MNSEAAKDGATRSLSNKDAKDFYVFKDGLSYAGVHLLIDMHGARNLNDISAVENALKCSVLETGATLLNIDLHHFSQHGGITGLAILAESHMSIHTWPETGFAAVDMFTCGECNAYKAVPVLKEHFHPNVLQVIEHKRGLVV